MATAPLIWADSFGSGDLSNYTGSGSIETGTGRGGRNALKISSSPFSATKNFPIVVSTETRYILSVAVKGSNCRAGIGGATWLITGGFLYVTRDSDSSHTTTQVKAWTETGYAHIAIAVTRDGSAGTVDIWVNEALVYSVTGVNTTSQSATAALTNGGSGSTLFSDLVIQLSDTTTDLPLGDLAVSYRPPTGDGTHTDLAPLTGTDHYAMVDETSPDDDTSYNSSATVGDADSYTFDDLASNIASVKAIVPKWRARKSDAGSRSLKPLLVISATDYEGDEQVLGTSYAQQYQVYETSPATDAAWTLTEANDLEAGVEVAS